MTHRRISENGKGERTTTRGAARAGRFSYEGLDRVMHEKARLSILASLAANAGRAGLLFNDLKKLCSLTDGNLSRHLAVLSDAGLVEGQEGTMKEAGGGGSRPQTMYRLTTAGRRRFAEYISVLEKVVVDAQADAQRDARRHGMSARWSPA